MNNRSNNNKPDKTTIHLLMDNYIIIEKIGSGSFGEVYLAECQDGAHRAAKIEDKKKPPRLLNEYKIYNKLHKSGFDVGLPYIYDFVQTNDYNIMFMQLLGPSLEDLFNKYDRTFKLPTVLLLADQLIVLMEKLHSTGFIHRDIKPNNFLIGKDHDMGQVFIMDFGLSRKYIVNGKHIKFRGSRSLIGTARYASINMHLGFEPSRRDELESIGYVLVYLMKGRLPWQGLKKQKGVSNIEAIGKVKMCIDASRLCTGLPSSFEDYLGYCQKLKFDETPDYKYLRNLFQQTCLEYNVIPSYCWT